jgi:hypothetical protein
MCTVLLPPGVNQMCTVLLPPGVNPMCTVLLPPGVNPIAADDSASNRNEYQEYFLGVKAAGA